MNHALQEDPKEHSKALVPLDGIIPRAAAGLCLVRPITIKLIPLDVVRFVLQATSEEVVGLIDCGRIRWVWNLSPKSSPARSLWRFLPKEILGGEVPATEADALQEAFGYTSRVRIRSSELEIGWCLSAQSIMRLGRVGQLKVDGNRTSSRTTWYEAESARAFLRDRILR